MLPIAIGVLLLTAPSPQSLTSPGRPPALLVRMAEEGPSQPLSIEKMDVQVSATAFLAETTTTIDRPSPRSWRKARKPCPGS